jgi:hypothetical protein
VTLPACRDRIYYSALANDYDPEGGALTLQSVEFVDPNQGQYLQAFPVGNQVMLTPTAAGTATIVLRYTISDPQGATATTTITVTLVSSTCS